MKFANPLKAAAVAEFNASVYRSGDMIVLGAKDGAKPEETILHLAAETLCPAADEGIVSAELRARLDAMTEDYAQILTRIDQMAIDAGAMSAAPRGQN